MSDNQYEVVIGMEFHLQANSVTKLFSRAPLNFGDDMNTHVSVVDAGMPGALPCVNKRCLELGIQMGLAMNMEIKKYTTFDRKHYSYPDLPLKYQITQFYEPIGEHGYLMINGRKIRLERLSLEADAGKNVHAGPSTYTDLNRCGTPLMEVVSSPDLRSAEEAAQLYRKIRSIARYLGTSKADMEKGQMRADVNISINKPGEEYGTRVEVKNIGSINHAKQAIEYEVERQIKMNDEGEEIVMETRGFDPASKRTYSMRKKESDLDYRYMPEPDLPTIEIDEQIVEEYRKNMIELPQDKEVRWQKDYGLIEYETGILAEEKPTADYFDNVIDFLKKDEVVLEKGVRQTVTWMLGDFFALLNKAGLPIDQCQVNAQSFSQLINAIVSEKISGKQGKDVLKKMFDSGKDAQEIIDAEGISQITNKDEIVSMIDKVIENNPKQVEQVRSGNQNLFGFLVGQVMKESRGKANPALVNDLLNERL